jgi:hypothetical protein
VSGRYVVSDEFARQFGEMARRLRYTQPQRSFPARRQHFTQTPSGIGFRNDSGETIPAFAVMEITGTVTVDSAVLFTVEKQGTELNRFMLVNGPDTVSTSQIYGTGSFVDLPDRVLYDSADGTPAAGQVWGPYPGSWALRRHMYGFRILGEADTNGTHVRCLQDPIFTGVLGKTDASHAKSATGTVSVWKGDHSADSGANISSVYNSFALVASGKWVHVGWTAETPALLAAEC